jgi:sarcosine oxidase subunit gamma
MLERSHALARLRVTSWLAERGAVDDVPQLGGQRFPAQAGATTRGSARILCLAPGDWLIVSSDVTASSLREGLQTELAAKGLVLADVTDAFESLEVRGPDARDLLSSGCGLDLHPHSFAAARCARTRFAQIPVVIECIDDSPRFELSVARSYFDYLHLWLTDAAAALENR